MFKDLSLESRNIQTQICLPLQWKVWPLNGHFLDFDHFDQMFCFFLRKFVSRCLMLASNEEKEQNIGLFELN